MKKIISVGALVALFSLTTGAEASIVSTTTLVTPSNPQGWILYNDQTDTANGTTQFKSGPITLPPLGTGSARFKLTGPNDGQAIVLPSYQGTKLSLMRELKYWTYQDFSNKSNVPAISLQFNIDQDVDDADNSYQGRMVYEPYYNNGGTVPIGQWKQWDTIKAGAGLWWFSKPASFGGNCPQSAPCTWSQILALYPGIGVHPTYGAVVLKAGSGWEEKWQGSADALNIRIRDVGVVYNFEANPILKEPIREVRR